MDGGRVDSRVEVGARGEVRLQDLKWQVAPSFGPRLLVFWPFRSHPRESRGCISSVSMTLLQCDDTNHDTVQRSDLREAGSGP